RQVLGRWLGADGAAHLLELLPHARERLGLFDWQTDGSPPLRPGVHNRLTNPPHSVGDEACAVFRVELTGSMQKAEIPLIDEVGEGQPISLIFIRNLDHKTEIALDEFAQGFSIPRSDT